ncbi:M48 family metallopeptidase [Ralstonia solanacearum]|uniref:M48 metallopeptidase family protein n=1 Tax=Ralstonia solanacearum TaxID=305 RepID=UPI002E1D923E
MHARRKNCCHGSTIRSPNRADSCGGARIRHFQSRWASCDAANILLFHPRVMELARSVQDYVIVHELCHTVEKNHTRVFWSLVARGDAWLATRA